MDAGVQTTPPRRVDDLDGRAVDHTSLSLTWTAPAPEPGGARVAMYELRYSQTPITDEPSFLAATSAVAPLPVPPGGRQTTTLSGLLPDTTYYAAVRARDEGGRLADVSNVASITTKPRARLLVSEIGMLNASGTDFIELLVTAAGAAGGIQVQRSSSATLIHQLAPLDVAAGDRIVIHLTGLPGPAGFVQEDAARDAAASTAPRATAAYDVYSKVDAAGLAGTSQLVRIADGTTTLDAVAYSNRTPEIASTAVTSWAEAFADGQWSFSSAPVDGCAAAAEVVNISTITTSNACGRAQSGMAAGKSIQRSGTTDTNALADFFVGPESPGLPNTL